VPDLKRIQVYDPVTDKDASVSPNGDLVVSLDGELVSSKGLVPETYDYIALALTTTTDTWTYKTGGSGGITVATVTITYTDTTKSTISSIART